MLEYALLVVPDTLAVRTAALDLWCAFFRYKTVCRKVREIERSVFAYLDCRVYALVAAC